MELICRLTLLGDAPRAAGQRRDRPGHAAVRSATTSPAPSAMHPGATRVGRPRRRHGARRHRPGHAARRRRPRPRAARRSGAGRAPNERLLQRFALTGLDRAVRVHARRPCRLISGWSVPRRGRLAHAAPVQRLLLRALLLLEDQPPRPRAASCCPAAAGRACRPSTAALTAQPGSWSCLQSRKRQWSIRSNTSANASLDAVPAAPQADGAHAGRVDQPARRRAAAPARTRWWCGARVGRPRAPSAVACRSWPTSAFTSVLLPTPLAPSSAMVPLPAA